MNYLELVNFVIEESGAEQDKLTVETWDTAVGRRLYPRLKKWVADSWREIQIERNQWEFMTGSATQLIQPAISFTNGSNPTPALAGLKVVGGTSGFSFTILSHEIIDGSLEDGDANGVLFFDGFSGNPPILGEELTSPDDPAFSATYSGPGSYKLAYIGDRYEVDQMSFTASNGRYVSAPVAPMPWENWRATSLSYSYGTYGVPSHFSENEMGRIVFYPTINNPFTLAYTFNHMPQSLSLPTDVPHDLPSMYHEVIAWKALMKLADYDKNLSLFSYARKGYVFWKNRMETNLMPRVGWRYPDL